MPELPEVETIRIGLQKAIVGKKIVEIEALEKKQFKGDEKEIIGQKILAVERLAKIIIFKLEGDLILAIHLKMTGQLIYQIKNQKSKIKNLIGGHPDKAYRKQTQLPHKYTRIIITFSDNSKLFFNDLRKFGWIKIIQNSNLTCPMVRRESQNDNLKLKLDNDFGIDALDKNLTSNYLWIKIKHKKQTAVKAILMNQDIISGIGNIYGDEICFCAGIKPQTKISQLKRSQIDKIVSCIPKILKQAIKLGGTSFSDYRKPDGSRGGYLDQAYVYQRKGEPCRVCQTLIEKVKIGQRSAHFCPKCQK